MSMTATKLAPLRSRLGELRLRRQFVRLGTGWAGFAAAIFSALLIAFILDMALEMSRLERVFSLGFCLLVGAAAWFWLLRPWLGQRESDLEMALLVESRLKIDSDLVAALQFEEPEAFKWGSGSLRGAVVDYVADFGNDVNVFEGLPVVPLRTRLIVLGVVVLLALPVVILRASYVPAFLGRLFLFSAHYPSDPKITEVRINGRVAERNTPLRFVHGKRLTIEVVANGSVVEAGKLGLRPSDRSDVGLGTRLAAALANWCFAGAPPDIDASPVVVPLSQVQTTDREQVFSGVTPPFIEATSFQVVLGNAWTEPYTIELTPLPVVTLDLEAIPPDYARSASDAPKASGSQVLSVIEGSEVAVTLTCTNKTLKSATLTVGGQAHELTPEKDRKKWTLNVDKTPFERVASAFVFSIDVVDEDDLSLDRPLTGHLRLQADREPRITAAIITNRVLPSAHPTLGYKATDDFGLAELRIHYEVQRHESRTTDTTVVTRLKFGPEDPPLVQLPLSDQYLTDLFVKLDKNDDKVLEATEIQESELPSGSVARQIFKPASKTAAGELNLAGFIAAGRTLTELRAALPALKLSKDDKVTVILEAVDYRGKSPGKSTLSEPVAFQVTDQSGILEGLTEADQKSAKQLDVIIQRQLGIGESP